MAERFSDKSILYSSEQVYRSSFKDTILSYITTDNNVIYIICSETESVVESLICQQCYPL